MRVSRRSSVLVLVVLLFGATLALAGGATAATPTTIFEIGDMEPEATWVEARDEFLTFGFIGVNTFDVDLPGLGRYDSELVPAGLVDEALSGDGSLADDRSVVTLNINFTLDNQYTDVELDVARFGVETDRIVVDGHKVFLEAGAGEGVRSAATLSVGELSKGAHTISFMLETPEEPVGSSTHVWDALILTGNQVTDFIDDDGSIFENDIEWMAAEGITRGCNPPINDRFCPDGEVTRGQMAAFLVRALGLTDSGEGDLFIDDDGSVFENDIDRLATAGITRGCNPPINDRYCPDGKVTRGQMAAFLTRAFGYTDSGAGDLFIDDDGSVFENDIDRLGTAGVTKGCNPPTNDRYCPTATVTRGQMAAFLHRAMG